MREAMFIASSQLRETIEKNLDAIIGSGYLGYEGFPTGCCGYTAHLLAHHLINLGICSPEQMRFPYNSYDREGEWRFGHGWILVDDKWNVDITADQFPGISDRVIVSDDSEFHKKFIVGEWVSFEEKHRRETWQDNGERFHRVWEIIQNALEADQTNT